MSRTRQAKRAEARAIAAEIAGELAPPERERLAALDPLIDLSDCEHGCNGSPCGAPCTFMCHLCEDDEDPAEIWARFGAAPKGTTARPGPRG